MPMVSEYLDSKGTSQPIDTPGVYKLIPAYIADDQLTKKGDRMIRVCWESEDGQSVWDNLAITDGAAFRWAQLWFGLGEQDTDFPSVSELASACIRGLNNSIPVYAKVKLEPYKGKKVEYKGTKVPSIERFLDPEEGQALAANAVNNNDEVPF